MGPHVPRRVLAVVLATVVVALGLVAVPAGQAAADESDEQQLAERYAPVVHLVEQPEPCGAGEPYQPSDVDALLGDDSVALRGPWTQQDLIAVGPDAKALSRPLRGYALDLPGNPLKPGCDYERWANRIWATSPPTVYAHVATEASRPGRLALQYWFYYPYNDFNNKHEGDWERIQLAFDAPDAAAALQVDPTSVVYSQHEGAERAAWGDDKLEISDGTHPAVYVSAGSHASRYSSGLFLLRSTAQGFGCDATLDPAPGVVPTVRTIPLDRAAARREFPWVEFRGAWGQRERVSFYSGASGPITKSQWTRPFTWADAATGTSYIVPGGQVYGVKTTDFFCSVVGNGSVLLLRYNDNPGPTLAVLAALGALVVWLVRRTSWASSHPLPVRRRRDVGQIAAAAWSTYRTHARLFLTIGLLVAAVSLVYGVAEQVLSSGSARGPVASEGRTVGRLVESVALLVVIFFSSASTMRALVEIDAGRTVRALDAHRASLSRAGALLGTLLLAVVLMLPLLLSLYLAPLVVAFVAAWALLVPVVVIEGRVGLDALRRSWQLTRGRLGKVVGVLLLGLLLLTLLGGLIGALILVAAQAPFVLVNLVPGVTNALIGPFVSLMIGYLYFDALADLDDPDDAHASGDLGDPGGAADPAARPVDSRGA